MKSEYPHTIPEFLFCTVVSIVASSLSVVFQDMQHPNFETRHPLQQEEQETGYDPLQNYNRNRDRKTPNTFTFKFEI